METINSLDGVHVHADMHELNRIRQALTASQLALWGDHSSKVGQLLGLSGNHIADVILNDCGLVAWAVAVPELGAAIGLGLTAVWSQLANLNALCDLVETKYQQGELTIDRKIGIEHQLLEFAATIPAWQKLGLLPLDGAAKTGGGKTGGGTGSTKTPAPIIVPPTQCLPPVPVDGPAPVIAPKPIHQPIGSAGDETSGAGNSGAGGSSHVNVNALAVEKQARLELPVSGGASTGQHTPAGQQAELQDSEQLQGASGYKGNNTQN